MGSTDNTKHLALGPDTIWITDTPDGVTAQVDDWGLKRACSVAAGREPTSPFTPPELENNPEQGSEHADVYSLGAVTYYALVGQPPTESGEFGTEKDNHIRPSTATTHPDVDERVDKVLLTALATDPADRYSSAFDYSGALVNVLPTEPHGGSPSVREAKSYSDEPDSDESVADVEQAHEESAQDSTQRERKVKLLSAAVLGVVGVVVMGIYVACFFGAPLPDAVPGCSGSSDIDVTVEEMVLNDEELHVVATVTDGGEIVDRTNEQMWFLVCEDECTPPNELGFNETVNIDNGSVAEQFPTGPLDLTEGEVYYAAIRYDGTLSESKSFEVPSEGLGDTVVDGPGEAVDDDPGEGEIRQTPKWVQTSENETVMLDIRGDIDLIGNDGNGESIDLLVEDGARNWSGRTEITENDFDFKKYMIPANHNIRSDDGPTRITAEHPESGISNTIIIGKYIPTVTPSENNENDINITVTNRDSQNEDILDLSVYDQNETELYSERVQMSVGEDDRTIELSDITVDEMLVVVEYHTGQHKEIHKEVVLKKEE